MANPDGQTDRQAATFPPSCNNKNAYNAFLCVPLSSGGREGKKGRIFHGSCIRGTTIRVGFLSPSVPTKKPVFFSYLNFDCITMQLSSD